MYPDVYNRRGLLSCDIIMLSQQHVQIENLCNMAAGWTMVATTAFYGMWGEENIQ